MTKGNRQPDADVEMITRVLEYGPHDGVMLYCGSGIVSFEEFARALRRAVLYGDVVQGDGLYALAMTPAPGGREEGRADA